MVLLPLICSQNEENAAIIFFTQFIDNLVTVESCLLNYNSSASKCMNVPCN